MQTVDFFFLAVPEQCYYYMGRGLGGLLCHAGGGSWVTAMCFSVKVKKSDSTTQNALLQICTDSQTFPRSSAVIRLTDRSNNPTNADVVSLKFSFLTNFN